jgi:hypothetical protein
MYNISGHYGFGFSTGGLWGFGFGGLVLLIVLWSLVWKGLTLWVTARRGDKLWFIVFLVLNTAGIGELIYLLVTDGFKDLHNHKKI